MEPLFVEDKSLIWLHIFKRVLQSSGSAVSFWVRQSSIWIELEGVTWHVVANGSTLFQDSVQTYCPIELKMRDGNNCTLPFLNYQSVLGNFLFIHCRCHTFKIAKRRFLFFLIFIWTKFKMVKSYSSSSPIPIPILDFIIYGHRRQYQSLVIHIFFSRDESVIFT